MRRTWRERAVASIMKARGCSMFEADRTCWRIEGMRPGVSYRSVERALQELEGREFTDEDVYRRARKLQKERAQRRAARKRPRPWRGLKKRKRGTGRGTRVKHWTGRG